MYIQQFYKGARMEFFFFHNQKDTPKILIELHILVKSKARLD